jgi:hypothetical protein
MGDSNYRVRASRLYGAYTAWIERNKEGTPLPQRRFGEEMTAKKFERKTNNGVWYIGIALRDNTENEGENQ